MTVLFGIIAWLMTWRKIIYLKQLWILECIILCPYNCQRHGPNKSIFCSNTIPGISHHISLQLLPSLQAVFSLQPVEKIIYTHVHVSAMLWKSNLQSTTIRIAASWPHEFQGRIPLFPVDCNTQQSNIFDAKSLFQTSHVVHWDAPYEDIFFCVPSWFFCVMWCSFTTCLSSGWALFISWRQNIIRINLESPGFTRQRACNAYYVFLFSWCPNFFYGDHLTIEDCKRRLWESELGALLLKPGEGQLKKNWIITGTELKAVKKMGAKELTVRYSTVDAIYSMRSIKE